MEAPRRRPDPPAAEQHLQRRARGDPGAKLARDRRRRPLPGGKVDTRRIHEVAHLQHRG